MKPTGRAWIRMMQAGAMAGTAVLAFAAVGGSLQAQSKPAGGAEPTTKTGAAPAARANTEPATKIAAINMRMAIASTAEGKQAAAQLDTEFQARRKELEDLNKKISDLQQKLTASGTVLSDEERNRLTLEGQKLTRQLDRRQNEFQEDLSDAQNEVISRIGRKVVDVVGKFAPSNGYGAVLDNSSQSTPVMYASTDITEEIVKLYDQTYPVKSAAETKPPTKSTAKPSGQ